MSTRNTQASKSPSPIDDPASPTSNGDESTELTIPPSTPSLRPTNTSIPSTPTSNIPTRYGSTSAMSDTTIEDHFGVHPRGRDAIASFPNNITKINPTDYTWVNDSSNYSLCHNTPGEPTQALLWLVGDIDRHSLETTNKYQIGRSTFYYQLRQTKPWIDCSRLVHGAHSPNQIATLY
ncbi:hypothetical protein DL95DRAFT_472310 [Leptodontidium sp. 2 PMI_412]|nr:hypothetical protein DL95DRAFT_472310 [Leptodontidium sp. 2 PMI_412]